jgi:hypothetical protein
LAVIVRIAHLTSGSTRPGGSGGGGGTGGGGACCASSVQLGRVRGRPRPPRLPGLPVSAGIASIGPVCSWSAMLGAEPPLLIFTFVPTIVTPCWSIRMKLPPTFRAILSFISTMNSLALISILSFTNRA